MISPLADDHASEFVAEISEFRAESGDLFVAGFGGNHGKVSRWNDRCLLFFIMLRLRMCVRFAQDDGDFWAA